MKTIDSAASSHSRVKEKEVEKIDTYQMMIEEIRNVCLMNKVIVIPVVVGALGFILDTFER